MTRELRIAKSKGMISAVKSLKKYMEKFAFDENMGTKNWELVRKVSDIGYQLLPSKNVKVKMKEINGTKFEITIPKNLTNDNIIYYIHGGGFVTGSILTSRSYSSMLATTSHSYVVSVDYSLAPEHPYPEGVNDCYKVYEYLVSKYKKQSISIIGESAGGNLALVVSLKAIHDGIKTPSSLVLNSSLLDLSDSLERKNDINDFTVRSGCIKALNEIYVRGDNRNYEISPIYGLINTLPPIFITADINETLYEDSNYLYKKCEELGVKVTMIEMQGSFHAFANVGTLSDETKTILEEECAFMNENGKSKE